MTDQTLPEPLVPIDVDLRDFGFMPLHVQRLRDSDLAAISTGDEFKAAVLLWAYSWHQVPAGSLPDDDRILAARSGANEKWPKVKVRALDGFIRCSDGRLYHGVIAASVLDAWERRDEFQAKQAHKETRQQRWRAELGRLSELLRTAGVTPPQRPTKAQLLSLCRLHVDGFVDADVDGRETRVDAGEVARTGRGRETETGTEKNKGAQPGATTLRAPAGEPNPDSEDRAQPAAGSGTPYGLAVLAMRQQGMSDAHPGDPRLRALVDAKVSIEEFQGIAREAIEKRKGFPWALVTLQNRRADVAANPVADKPEVDWRTSRSTIVARAVQLGLQTWEQVEAEHIRRGKTPSFSQYLLQIEAADAAAQRSPA